MGDLWGEVFRVHTDVKIGRLAEVADPNPSRERHKGGATGSGAEVYGREGYFHLGAVG